MSEIWTVAKTRKTGKTQRNRGLAGLAAYDLWSERTEKVIPYIDRWRRMMHYEKTKND